VTKIVALAAAGVLALMAAAPAMAQTANWRLVGGVNDTPAHYLSIHPECSAVYGWDGPTQQWLHYFAGTPDYVNDYRGLTSMEALKGYWVKC
jgi:hypothetical protein